MRGGLSNAGSDCGIFFVNVAIAASHANWPIGAALLMYTLSYAWWIFW